MSNVCDLATEDATWQHPTMGHVTRFAVADTCSLLFGRKS